MNKTISETIEGYREELKNSRKTANQKLKDSKEIIVYLEKIIKFKDEEIAELRRENEELKQNNG